MKVGPLRRVTGAVGLMALVPVGLMLFAGALTVPDAAQRAGAILLATLAVGRVAGWWLTALAEGFERDNGAADPRPAPRAERGRSSPTGSASDTASGPPPTEATS